MATNRPDDFQTPASALLPLFGFLNPNWTIWECACGKGNLVKEFNKNNFKVIASDLYLSDEQNVLFNGWQTKLLAKYHYTNFLTWEPDEWDCIITNPPFSLKTEFLIRAYNLGKPFAFLLP
mgnify:FL=1